MAAIAEGFSLVRAISADRQGSQLATIRSQIEATPGINSVLELLTMYLGPDHLIVAARIAFDDNLSADSAEHVADSIDARLSAQLAVIPHVFLDPTQLPA